MHSKDRQKRGRGIDKETAKILEMRAQVVKELFETENTYGDQLKVLLKSFVDPLKSFAAESKPDTPLYKVVYDPAVSACINALPLISELTSKIRYILLVFFFPSASINGVCYYILLLTFLFYCICNK